MLRCRRVPDLTGEQAVPYRIKSLDGMHTNRESPPDELIVLGCPLIFVIDFHFSFFPLSNSISPYILSICIRFNLEFCVDRLVVTLPKDFGRSHCRMMTW